MKCKDIVINDNYYHKEVGMIERMLDESQTLFDYDNNKSALYESEIKPMLDYVNHHMKNVGNIHELLGGNTLELMFNNHANHVQFMANVIKYKQSDLLVHTLPWVYKAYHQKGVSYDYFPKELHYWIQAMKRYILDDVKDDFIRIYEQMIAWHDVLIKISESDEIQQFTMQHPWTNEHEQMLKYLLDGDYVAAKEMTFDILKTPSNILDVYMEIFQPVMYKIGDLWSRNEITVAHEHLASSIISRIMASTYSDYVLTDVKKGKAIVTASVSEHHQIGARMVADALEHDGWQVFYLGANVPNSELLALIKEVSPVFISLSMTMAYHLDALLELIHMIKDNTDNDSIKIMVGGLAFNESPSLSHVVQADGFPRTAKDSCDIANRWWHERAKL